MENASRLTQLFARWEEAWEQGHELPTVELCRDCPELLPELQQRTEAVKKVDHLVRRLRGSVPSPVQTHMLHSGETIVQTAHPAIPGYEVLGELGRGSMGIVYKARQVQLDRLVALKVVLWGSQAEPGELARLQREAAAIGTLNHPHIVQIHEVGEWRPEDGAVVLPYLCLEFCPGGSLDEKLGGAPLPPSEAAGLAETLARAVHALHEQKVIHRDLKPANVLLTADGTVKITDFGLAKRLDAARAATQSGATVGTPSYMAPEQAAGRTREVGPLADVYALGAILYECLTGRPPFLAASVYDTILQVTHDEPVAVRVLQPKTPRDLETICLKCLQKDPRRRYGSARELAEDLRRFQAGEPIQARPVGIVERAAKWVRRRPAVAMLLAISVLCAASLSGSASWFTLRLWEAKIAAENAQREIQTQLDRAESFAYFQQLSQAQLEYRGGNTAAAREQLEACDPKLRHYEHGLLERLYADSCLRTIAGQTDRFLTVAFSPDGTRIAGGGHDGAVTIWDSRTGEQVLSLTGHRDRVTTVAFSPDGGRLVSAGVDRTVRVWDLATGDELQSFRGPSGSVKPVAFSPDGTRLVIAGGDPTVRVVQVQTGHEEQPFTVASGAVYAVALSPDGTCLAAAHGDGADPDSRSSITLWEVRTRRVIASWKPHRTAITSLAFCPESKVLATAGRDRTVWFWESGTGEKIGSLPGRHREGVTDIAFSPDGRRLFTSSRDRIVRGWDTARFQQVLTLTGHTKDVSALAVSPDGTRLVSTSEDRTVRLWDVRPGRAPFSLHGHLAGVSAVAFNPTGTLLAGAGADGTIHVWKVRTAEPLFCLAGHTSGVTALAFSPDGTHLASAGKDRSVLVWDAQTGHQAGCLGGHTNVVTAVAFCADGIHLASAGKDETLRVWDWRRGRQARSFPGCAAGEGGIAFSPAGKYLAVADLDHAVRIVEVQTGKVRSLAGHTGPVTAVAFSRDEGSLASASVDRTVRLWDLQTDQTRRSFTEGTGTLTVLAFSADGARLVGAGMPSRMAERKLPEEADDSGNIPEVSETGEKRWKMWDSKSGQQLLAFTGRIDLITALAFSPDDTLLASAGKDGTVKLWDARSAQSEANDFAWHQEQVIESEAREEWFAAAFHLSRCLAVSPRCSPLLVRRMQTRVRLGQADLALEDLLRAVEYAAGTSLAQEPPVEEVPAVRELVETLEKRAREGKAGWIEWAALAWLHEREGRRDDVAADLAEATRTQPQRASLWAWRVRAELARGRLDLAETLAARLATLAPEESQSWHRQAASRCDRDSRLSLAHWHITQLLAVRPPDAASLRLYRGHLAARLGLWSDAATDFERVAREDPTDWQARVWHTRVCLAAGNRSGYRQGCRDLLARCDQSRNLDLAQAVVQTCVLTFDSMTDWEPVLELARRSASVRKDAETQTVLAAALLRAGQPRNALARLEEVLPDLEIAASRGILPTTLWSQPFSRKASSSFALSRGDQLLLALANHGSGNAVEAQRWLNESLIELQDIPEKDFPKPGPVPPIPDVDKEKERNPPRLDLPPDKPEPILFKIVQKPQVLELPPDDPPGIPPTVRLAVGGLAGAWPLLAAVHAETRTESLKRVQEVGWEDWVRERELRNEVESSLRAVWAHRQGASVVGAGAAGPWAALLATHADVSGLRRVDRFIEPTLDLPPDRAMPRPLPERAMPKIDSSDLP